MTRRDVLQVVRDAAREATAAGELSTFLGQLETVRVEALAAFTAAPKARSRVLTVEETASLLGRSRSWVYKHKAALPIVRFPTGGFGFDERKLERWIEARTR